jgi:hypothetical protein
MDALPWLFAPIPDGAWKMLFWVGFLIALGVGLTGVGAGAVTAPD